MHKVQRSLGAPVMLALALSMLAVSVGADERSGVTIGVLLDGRSQRMQLLGDLLRDEILALTSSDFRADLSSEHTVVADWTMTGVESGLDRLLDDSGWGSWGLDHGWGRRGLDLRCRGARGGNTSRRSHGSAQGDDVASFAQHFHELLRLALGDCEGETGLSVPSHTAFEVAKTSEDNVVAIDGWVLHSSSPIRATSSRSQSGLTVFGSMPAGMRTYPLRIPRLINRLDIIRERTTASPSRQNTIGRILPFFRAISSTNSKKVLPGFPRTETALGR